MAKRQDAQFGLIGPHQCSVAEEDRRKVYSTYDSTNCDDLYKGWNSENIHNHQNVCRRLTENMFIFYYLRLFDD